MLSIKTNNCPNCNKFYAKKQENGSWVCINCQTNFNIENVKYSNPLELKPVLKLIKLLAIAWIFYEETIR